MRTLTWIAILSCFAGVARSANSSDNVNWKELLRERLPVYGHRNWIVVADSAYPAQSRAGIETVVSGEDQFPVLRYVLGVLAQAKHVRAHVLLDQELQYVPESEAPGVEAYRRELRGLVQRQTPEVLTHEQIIAKLDEAGQTFRILIIKTNLTIPYTSVFLRLDCAYWSAEDEEKLRGAIKAHDH
jgi:L-fucose mutarotase/ribose pyranase (RbsD/FucU family)